jgi:ABC-type Fe3+/spermidine/putrescine transport system ATPase subunit
MYKLSKFYPGGKQVIKDISLSFLPGAKIGVLGGNGAGKSTLLKILAGIDKEYSGEAKLADGIKVGYLAQEPNLNSNLNVYENVMEGMAEAKKLVDDFNTISFKFSEDLTDEEMNEMYNHPKVKAHLTFTHGEGFGRPLLEASISQKPIIASNWSGHKDFLNKNNAVLLPGTMTKVSKSSFPDEMYVDEAHWFTVNYQYTFHQEKMILIPLS